MHIQAISLFPEAFHAVTTCGVTGRALRNGLWTFDCINPRRFADRPGGFVDDRPFGGGAGMVMMAPPLQAAIDEAQSRCPGAMLICPSPQGVPLGHAIAAHMARQTGLIILCGRYEGIDERLLECNRFTEVCVSDAVVSGGELPAMMIMDAVLRLRPGTLGNASSAQQDSFADGLLDYPHYTRPAVFRGVAVPAVLRSGNHAAIAQWRRDAALQRTARRRPDLLKKHLSNPEESSLLAHQEERDHHI